jgi:hypothetical protein
MKYVYIFLLLFLSGCTASVNRQFANAYGVNIIARNLTTTGVQNHQISPERARAMMATQDEARAILDASWAIRILYPEKAQQAINQSTDSTEVTMTELQKSGVQ